MKYPHAYSGVKKLFISEILNTISAGLMFAAVLMVLLDGKTKLPDIDTAQFWGLATLVLLSSAVGIAAFVIQFIGLNQARKDERLFKKAMYFVIICGICTVAMMFTTGAFGKITATVDEVSTLLMNVYVITAVYSIAFQAGDAAMQKRAKLGMLFVSIPFFVAFCLQFAIVYLPDIAEILTVIGAALDFVGYVVFMIYLGIEKKALAKMA